MPVQQKFLSYYFEKQELCFCHLETDLPKNLNPKIIPQAIAMTDLCIL